MRKPATLRSAPTCRRLGARLFALLGAIFFFVAGTNTQALSFWDDLPDEELLDVLLAEMPDEDIIAQTFMIGWVGQAPSPEVVQWITERNLGGVKIFGWNGGDLIALAGAIGTMQELAGNHGFSIPLLTATDQEGGWVRHIKGDDDLSTATTPGNMAIAAAALPYDAYRSAYYIGLELRALGVNMNFAPTVDVYVNPDAHVIGPRAFSDDPVMSGLLGVAYFHGLEEARVISTAKHFPGHGNASGDSHGILPVIEDSFDVLWERDLLPYRFLVSEGLPAVLSGHLSFPNVTGDGRPASLSPYFKQTVLRDTLGFRGIVMTDDLYMGGAWQYGAEHGWGIAQIVVEALRAGNDMVMLSRTPELNGQIWNAVLAEFQADARFRERVTAAARSVLRIKLQYLKDDNRVPLQPDPALLPRQISVNGGATYFRDQAARSVTLVRSTDIPYQPEDNERILLAGKDGDFLRIGREFYPDADQFRISNPVFEYASETDKNRFRDVVPGYDTVLYCLSDPNSLEVLQEIAETDVRVIVMSILTPVYLLELPWVQSAVAVYGWGDESFRAGFSVLAGQMDAEGTLPIRLDHPAAIPSVSE
ncbi:MAG: glycoside hydrolase family 3 protein [Spirochaetales bacterium]|nr:glycoside hydrolase family 3 protein [Spirochaetales bacterium]